MYKFEERKSVNECHNRNDGRAAIINGSEKMKNFRQEDRNGERKRGKRECVKIEKERGVK